VIPDKLGLFPDFSLENGHAKLLLGALHSEKQAVAAELPAGNAAAGKCQASRGRHC
jgi:hypothetical protein